MSLTFKGPVPVPATQTHGLTILVTGAGRGIGFELVQQYAAAHKANVIFAGVRDPNTAQVKLLSSIPNVHIVIIDVSDEQSVRSSVKEVSSVADRLDILIANAGIYGEASAADPTTVSVKDFTAVFQTNVVGVLLTIQGYLPLLRKSDEPKVATVSSALGSNQFVNAFGKPTTSYGVSKAAVNYLTSAFRYAAPEIAFFSLHPGWVDTDMGKGNGGAPPTKVSDSAQAIRYYVNERDLSHSGEFIDTMTGDLTPY